MSRLTRDGTAEPVLRDQIREREQGNINFPCSADHEQDWQPYPVDPYSAACDDRTYIHTPTPSPPFPRYAKRPDGALYAIDPLFLLPILFSPYCTLKVPIPNTIRFGNRPPLILVSLLSRQILLVRKVVVVISRARLYEVVRWSGLLRCATMMAKHDPMMYDAEFGVVFLEKGPHAAFIQESLDCHGRSHSGLERESHFRLVVELT